MRRLGICRSVRLSRSRVRDDASLTVLPFRCAANDFQFSHHAPGQTFGAAASTGKPTPKKAKRAAGADLFASTEADFFGFSKKGGPPWHCPRFLALERLITAL